MSYNYQNTPPPPGYGAPPPQGQYGAPPSQAQYGAPPPGQYGAPPPGQYGAPPPGQYGAPPPGQYGAPPPGQYGAPPPGQHPPPPSQYGAPPPQGEYPSPAGQYGAPPLQQAGGYPLPPPQQAYQQPPPPQQPQQPNIVFKCSAANDGILNSSFTDPWGRVAWSVASPSKKETYIKKMDGTTVGHLKWHSHSAADMEFKGYKGHPRDFVPPGGDEHTRRIRYDKEDYNVVEIQGTVYFRPKSAPNQTCAIIRDPNGMTEIEVTPSGLALGNGFIEHVLLVAVLYQSGVPFRDKTPISGSQYGMWAAQGAIAGSYS